MNYTFHILCLRRLRRICLLCVLCYKQHNSRPTTTAKNSLLFWESIVLFCIHNMKEHLKFYWKCILSAVHTRHTTHTYTGGTHQPTPERTHAICVRASLHPAYANFPPNGQKRRRKKTFATLRSQCRRVHKFSARCVFRNILLPICETNFTYIFRCVNVSDKIHCAPYIPPHHVRGQSLSLTNSCATLRLFARALRSVYCRHSSYSQLFHRMRSDMPFSTVASRFW